MNHYPNRRTFLDAPHSHTRTQRTASPMHSQSWSDLKQQADDQFAVARGVLNAVILMGAVWAVVVAAVFAVVAILG